jgi:2-polyprenyl-6-hydroxyphenyl methylase/3-demethylubiquinone-9 3-methyltransferase
MNRRWKIAQFAEIRWWRRYLRRKEPESYLESKRAYWERVLQTMGVDAPPGAAVLDAGCGPAGIFMVLAGRRVTAVDPLLPAYEELPHFSTANYPWVQFRPQTIESLGDQAAYDYIFCLNVINHVADLSRSLERLHAAARPDGRLILSVDAHNFRFFRRLFGWIPGDILHPHQYFLREYLQKLEEAGWRVERTQLLRKGFLFDYYGVAACRRGV